jgi:hypothetical protein
MCGADEESELDEPTLVLALEVETGVSSHDAGEADWASFWCPELDLNVEERASEAPPRTPDVRVNSTPPSGCCLCVVDHGLFSGLSNTAATSKTAAGCFSFSNSTSLSARSSELSSCGWLADTCLTVFRCECECGLVRECECEKSHELTVVCWWAFEREGMRRRS